MHKIDDAIEARIAGYIGIAQKAGKIAAGDMLTQEALKANKATMLLIAADAAASVKEELLPQAERKNLPVLEWKDKDSLGLVVGKSRRGALALCDAGFTKAILKVLKEAEEKSKI